jgi:hypothetical protein
MTRLKRAGLFVAIVWSLAATFVAIEWLALLATQLAASNPAVVGEVLVPAITQESKACLVDPGERAAEAKQMAGSEALLLAWWLGISVGRDADTRQGFGSDARTANAAAAMVREHVALLAVPAPAAFVVKQTANAPTEFLEAIELDEQRTAHTLAVSYSPDTCRLYKVGALWGYLMATRANVGQNFAVLSIALRHHARQMQLPEHLWEPMVGTPRGATGKERQAEILALTDAVAKYFQAAP